MNSLWQRFQKYFLRYSEIGFTIDISRMRFADDFLQSMGARAQRAFSEMRQLEAGAVANVDERRMVGHYWLRNPGLAPSASLRNDIEETKARIKKFAAEIHAGDIAPASSCRISENALWARAPINCRKSSANRIRLMSIVKPISL